MELKPICVMREPRASSASSGNDEPQPQRPVIKVHRRLSKQVSLNERKTSSPSSVNEEAQSQRPISKVQRRLSKQMSMNLPKRSSSPSSSNEEAPPQRPNGKLQRRLSRQMSMSEIPRNIAWERRRRQFHRQEQRGKSSEAADVLTDEDLNELKGCIELGFGFSEENGQRLCNTIPALDLYFAVNRQFATSPVASPTSNGPPPLGSPSSSSLLCNPGDDPQHVKTKLRHWAQAVACSMMQSS